MKMTRNAAIGMFQTLGAMALGNLNDEVLTATMDNFNAFRKVADDFEALKKELHKRIYGDVEKMDEDERKRYTDFMSLLEKMGRTKEAEKVDELAKLAKDTYADLYAMREKEVKVLVSLLNKEIDVEVTPVDADEFCKGVIRGKKDTPIHEIRAVFSFMFKKEEKNEDEKEDFSELDDLLKDKE